MKTEDTLTSSRILKGEAGQRINWNNKVGEFIIVEGTGLFIFVTPKTFNV